MHTLALLAFTLFAAPDFHPDRDAPEPSELAASTATTPILPIDVILFDFDSILLDEADRAQLTAVARWMLTHPGHRLVIRAHTDWVGEDAYNEHLAAMRASMVRAQLRVDGMIRGDVTEVICGERASLGQSDAADRRVVLYATTLTAPAPTC